MAEPTPSTSAAVLSQPAHVAPDSSDARVLVHLRREALGFGALSTATCPRCHARGASQLDSLSLRRPNVVMRTVEAVSLPATYAAACALLLAGEEAMGFMTLVFGPALLTGLAALARLT